MFDSVTHCSQIHFQILIMSHRSSMTFLARSLANGPEIDDSAKPEDNARIIVSFPLKFLCDQIENIILCFIPASSVIDKISRS